MFCNTMFHIKPIQQFYLGLLLLQGAYMYLDLHYD